MIMKSLVSVGLISTLMSSATVYAAPFKAPAPNEPVIFFIPGAAYSGDRSWLVAFSWVGKLLGSRPCFGKFQKEAKKRGLG
jgi:hypothetical protein